MARPNPAQRPRRMTFPSTGPLLQYPRPKMEAGARRFRSRGQVYTLGSFGLLVIVVGVLGAAHQTTTTARVGDAVAAVIVGLACVVVGVRAVLLTDADGIAIRNPFGRTRRIGWAEISGFRIGRYKLLGAVCLVELRDGSTLHASAVQIPHASRNTATSRESQMIDELNQLLASAKST
jgi:hypothetical protein